MHFTVLEPLATFTRKGLPQHTHFFRGVLYTRTFLAVCTGAALTMALRLRLTGCGLPQRFIQVNPLQAILGSNQPDATDYEVSHYPLPYIHTSHVQNSSSGHSPSAGKKSSGFSSGHSPTAGKKSSGSRALSASAATLTFLAGDGESKQMTS